MPYNYDKLHGKIAEKYGSQVKFAENLGLSTRSISLKLNGKRQFKQSEITQICSMLDIPENEIASYFFSIKVQNS
ncbi:MAG: DUF739 family protein [Lachnospiraceae bacterium]|nr:DUF739 family protein [Lachnospiraceae bacterium]